MSDNNNMSRGNEHDAVFRASMALPGVHEPFFKHFLNKSVEQYLDYKTIEPVNGSFIDEQLKLSVCDAVFRVKIAGETAYITILVEHQSTARKMMPLRIERYKQNILEYDAKKNKGKKKPLRFIYPVILYHGKKPYKYSVDIKDLIDAPKKLIDELWGKPAQLLDFSQYSDEELSKYPGIGALGCTLRHIWEDQRQHLPKVLAMLHMHKGEDYVFLEGYLLEYVLRKGRISKQSLFEIIESQASDEAESEMITVSEQLKAEGRQEGIQQGIEKGIEKGMKKGVQQQALSAARKMLSKGFDLVTIADILDLSLAQTQQLVVPVD